MKYETSNAAAYYLFTFLIVAVPLSFWTGLENGFDLVKSFLFGVTGSIFIILILLSVRKSQNKFQFELVIDFRYDLPILLLFISIVISSVFSVTWYSSINGSYDRQIGLLFYISVILVYALSPLILNSSKRVDNVFTVIETAGFIIALFPVVEMLGANPFGIRPPNFVRPFSPVGHPVFTAGFLTLVLPISLLNISGKKSNLLKYLCPSFIVIGILLTLTRTSIAALIIQILAAAILIKFINSSGKLNLVKIAFKAALFILPFIIILTLFINIFPESLPVKRIQSLLHLTTQPRWYLWQDSFNMFMHNFLTGTGPGNFSYVFENYASDQLKLSEIGRLYDSAHNNFLNTLCTTGLLGGLSYAALIFSLIIISFREVINNMQSRTNKFFFLAIFCSICGYAVYGLADFDDITIIVLLFVLISVLKAKLFMINNVKVRIFKHGFSSTGRFLIIIPVLIFSAYVSYQSTTKLIAEIRFSNGVNKYNGGSFQEFQSHINGAIELQPGQSQYRFKHAAYLFDYCSRNITLNSDFRKKLFQDAKDELLVSQEKYISKLKCLEMRSLIELEEGNKEAGSKLRDEIFRIDTCRFNYRANLAMYYLKNNEDSSALGEIQFVLRYDPKGTDANVAYATYLEKNKKYAEALSVCRAILEAKPDSRYAKDTIARLTQIMKKGK